MACPKIGAGLADSFQSRRRLQTAREWGASPREFDGWTPQEVHEHFDVEGNLTGTTVVTRESAWDDVSRGRALALAEYEASLCPCGCGQPMEKAHDPKSVWVVEKFTCMAAKAQARVEREYAKRHKNAAEGHDDGLNWYARPYDPERDRSARGTQQGDGSLE